MDNIVNEITKKMQKVGAESNMRINLPINLLKRGEPKDEAALCGKIKALIESEGYECKWFDGKFWLFGYIPYRFRGFIIRKRPLKTQRVDLPGGYYYLEPAEDCPTVWLLTELTIGSPKNISI